MAIAATNNAERMVHFLVSDFAVGSGNLESGFVDWVLDLGQNLRVIVRMIGQIVERAKSLRTVISLIVPTKRKIEQNRKERKFPQLPGKL